MSSWLPYACFRNIDDWHYYVLRILLKFNLMLVFYCNSTLFHVKLLKALAVHSQVKWGGAVQIHIPVHPPPLSCVLHKALESRVPNNCVVRSFAMLRVILPRRRLSEPSEGSAGKLTSSLHKRSLLFADLDFIIVTPPEYSLFGVTCGVLRIAVSLFLRVGFFFSDASLLPQVFLLYFLCTGCCYCVRV